MSRLAYVTGVALLAPAVWCQTSFTLRVSPKVTLADGEKMVVPMELHNTGTTPLQFGSSTQNRKWGLAGFTVAPGRQVGLALSTFLVSPQASKTIPPGHLFNTGPFGLHLTGGNIVHVNCNPPSNSASYIRVPVAFGSAGLAAAPTLALPASKLEPARNPRNPGEICWGISWVPGLKHAGLLNHNVGARGACLVACGDLKSGKQMVVNVFGGTGHTYVVLWSPTTGSLPLPWGKLRLGLAAVFPFLVGTVPAAGAGRTWISIPAGVPPGIRLYLQALLFDTSLTPVELTNLAQITST